MVLRQKQFKHVNHLLWHRRRWLSRQIERLERRCRPNDRTSDFIIFTLEISRVGPCFSEKTFDRAHAIMSRESECKWRCMSLHWWNIETAYVQKDLSALRWRSLSRSLKRAARAALEPTVNTGCRQWPLVLPALRWCSVINSALLMTSCEVNCICQLFSFYLTTLRGWIWLLGTLKDELGSQGPIIGRCWKVWHRFHETHLAVETLCLQVLWPETWFNHSYASLMCSWCESQTWCCEVSKFTTLTTTPRSGKTIGFVLWFIGNQRLIGSQARSQQDVQWFHTCFFPSDRFACVTSLTKTLGSHVASFWCIYIDHCDVR